MNTCIAQDMILFSETYAEFYLNGCWVAWLQHRRSGWFCACLFESDRYVHRFPVKKWNFIQKSIIHLSWQLLEVRRKELSVKDIQQYLGLGSVQSVYHWLNGISIPTIDNLYALSELFQVLIDDMICGSRKKYVYQPQIQRKKRLYVYYLEVNNRAA